MPLSLSITQPPPAETLLASRKAAADAAVNALHIATVEGFREFWHGPVPTEELLATLGTNAASWFDRHAQAVTFLLTIGEPIAPEDYAPPRKYTVQKDGSITLDPE